MEKKFNLSEQYNKDQKINSNFYVIMASLACVGIFIAIVHNSKDKDTILGAIALIIFMSVVFVIRRFIDTLFSNNIKTKTLIYTFYDDRILYQTDKNNEVIFLDEISSVSSHYDKRLSLYEIYFYITNSRIDCVCSGQRDFHEYLKKYLNENGIDNNL